MEDVRFTSKKGNTKNWYPFVNNPSPQSVFLKIKETDFKITFQKKPFPLEYDHWIQSCWRDVAGLKVKGIFNETMYSELRKIRLDLSGPFKKFEKEGKGNNTEKLNSVNLPRISRSDIEKVLNIVTIVCKLKAPAKDRLFTFLSQSTIDHETHDLLVQESKKTLMRGSIQRDVIEKIAVEPPSEKINLVIFKALKEKYHGRYLPYTIQNLSWDLKKAGLLEYAKEVIDDKYDELDI